MVCLAHTNPSPHPSHSRPLEYTHEITHDTLFRYTSTTTSWPSQMTSKPLKLPIFLDRLFPPVPTSIVRFLVLNWAQTVYVRSHHLLVGNSDLKSIPATACHLQGYRDFFMWITPEPHFGPSFAIFTSQSPRLDHVSCSSHVRLDHVSCSSF